MLIEKLELKEFGKHAALEASIGAPVVGLLGPNASGKSTILAAIKWAFTGELGGKDNPAESFVRHWGQDGASNGSVRIHFRKNGIAGVIFRQCGKTAKRSLVWDGQPPITKAADIETALQEILGADKLALSNAVFIPQGELDKMLFGLPSEREVLFVRLLLMAHLEKTCNILDGKIKHLSAGLVDFSAVIDELNRQRADAEQVLGTLEIRQREHRDWSEDIRILTAYTTSITEANEALRSSEFKTTELRERREQVHKASRSLPVRGSLTELRSAASSKRAEHFSLVNSRAKLEEARERQFRLRDAHAAMLKAAADVVDLEEQLRVARCSVDGLALEDLEARSAAAVAKQDAVIRLEAAEDAVLAAGEAQDTHLTQPAPCTEEQVAQAEAALETLRETSFRASLKHQVHQAAAQSGAGGGDCPICAHAVGSGVFTAAHIAMLEKEAKELAARGATSAAELARMRSGNAAYASTLLRLTDAAAAAGAAYLKARKAVPTTPDEDLPALRQAADVLKAAAGAVASLTRGLTKAQADLRDATGAHRNLADAHQQFGVVYSEDDLQEVSLSATQVAGEVQVYDSACAVLAPLEKEIDQLEGELKETTANHGRLCAKCDVLLAVHSAPLLSVLSTEGVNAAATLATRQAAYLALAGEIRAARATADALKVRQNELDDRMTRDAGKRQLIDELRALKETLTRGGLPMAYVRYQFSRLAALTRANLAKMESNFTVEQDPERTASFVFTRVDDDQTYVMTQDKLSGGQRVRLTVAFLLAVQQHLLPEVGFLVLDEPSQGLDDESVEALKDLLLDIGSSLGSSESQVLVCDHKPALEPAFGAILRTTKSSPTTS